jgi:hypothetical protein
MTTTQTAQAARVTYRKTRDGEWVAFGPISAIKPMTVVTVTKRDGSTKTEEIVEVGKTFVVGGERMRYGYLYKPATSRNGYSASYSCADCQDIEDAGDGRGCSRHRGNPRN